LTPPQLQSLQEELGRIGECEIPLRPTSTSFHESYRLLAPTDEDGLAKMRCDCRELIAAPGAEHFEHCLTCAQVQEGP
jgi:hypothetical protein